LGHVHCFLRINVQPDNHAVNGDFLEVRELYDLGIGTVKEEPDGNEGRHRTEYGAYRQDKHHSPTLSTCLFHFSRLIDYVTLADRLWQVEKCL
jgi:hypothetical protein